MGAPKKRPRNTTFAEAAGANFVLSELARRGIVAVHTPGRTTGVDILAMKRAGNRLSFRALEVKATLNPEPEGFWPLSKPGNTPINKNLFYVFVRMGPGKGKSRALEGYVVPSTRVQRERSKPSGNWRGSWYLPESEEERKKLLDWDSLWK